MALIRGIRAIRDQFRFRLRLFRFVKQQSNLYASSADFAESHKKTEQTAEYAKYAES